jgi:hypothetical protein
LDTSLPQINASAYQSHARKASFPPATNASAPLGPFKHLSNAKHALNPIANLVAPSSVSDAMIRFTFQLISTARNVCPTANYAIQLTLAIFALMGTSTIPTLHNASVHLPKAAPFSSVALSSSAVQSTVLSVTASPNAPSAPLAFQ